MARNTITECVSSTRTPVTVTMNPLPTPTLTSSDGDNVFCSGTSVTFTAGGGTNYNFRVAPTSVQSGVLATYTTSTLTNGQVVDVIVTNANGCIATSAGITNSVNALPSPTLSSSDTDNKFCAGTSVTFTVGGGTNYNFRVGSVSVQNGLSAIYSTSSLNNGQVVDVIVTNANGCTATSASITNIVDPLLPVSVSVSPSANTVCAGTSVTFTATPTNGGAIPAYQWKVNGTNAGANNPVYTYAPSNGDIVTCLLTSNVTCTTGNPATSNAINMTVNAILPVSVSVSPSANPVCAGTSVTFTATPANGGTTPAYQWKVNGANVGTNSSTYTYVPGNNDAITCVVTSNATCATGSPATSNAITMTVNALLPVSVSVSASANPVCAGTSVTFTATATNGGTTPAYQWKVNGTNTGANNTTYNYTPANGDIVTCVVTSSATCATGSPATSNAINMTVNALLPVNVSVSPSANPVCAGTSVTFTATPANGGTAPAYQWKVNGANVGTTNSTYSYVPANNDAVTCVLTSNATCATGSPATSNAITMTVNALLPASVSVPHRLILFVQAHLSPLRPHRPMEEQHLLISGR